MKIVSFNVNSVRQRLHHLASAIERHEPEFIGLQETKVQDHEFPLAEIEALGYRVMDSGGCLSGKVLGKAVYTNLIEPLATEG